MPEVTQIEVKGKIYDIRDETARMRSIPSSGHSGQVLAKNSDVNYDASWKYLDTPSMSVDNNTLIISTGAGAQYIDLIDDAPSDNKYYVRHGGAWVELGSLDGEEF